MRKVSRSENNINNNIKEAMEHTAGQWAPTPGGNKNCIGMRNGRDKCVNELSQGYSPNKAEYGSSQCKQCQNYDSAHMSSKKNKDAIASFKAMMVNKHGSATPMNQPIGHDEFIDIRNKTETLRGRGVLSEPEYHSEMLINYTRHHANGHCLQEGCEFTTPVEVIQKRHQMMVDQARIDHNKLSSVVEATDDPLAFAHSLQTAPKQKDQNQPILEPSEAVEGEGIGALGELAALASFKAMMVNKHGSATPMDQPIGHDEFIDIRNKTERNRSRGVLTEPEYHTEMLINYNRHYANGHCLQEGCEFTTPFEVIRQRHQMMVDKAHIDHDKLGSIVQAGAWPSETDWDGHLHNLEELLAETQKGVGWHAAKDEMKEMKAHDKLAKDLQKVIDDIKKVMKFPAAKTASVETDDWRDDHSNLDSDW